MDTLIRFEDRYGMAAIAQQVCMLLHDGADIEALGYRFENNTGVPGVLKLDIDNFKDYYKDGVRRIVFVFDLDSDNASRHPLVNVDKLSDMLYNLEILLQEAGVAIRLEYVPTVYMAETIALYQEMDKLNVLPELCVNKYSFKTLQASLLRVLFKLENERIVKRFPEYLIPDKIITAAKFTNSAFNAKLFDILLDLENHGYNKDEAIEHCKTAIRLFDACMDVDISINVNGYEFTNGMTIDEMRQQVTNYLISIGKKQRR